MTTVADRIALYERIQKEEEERFAGRTADSLFNTPWPIRRVAVDGADTNPHHASYISQSKFTGGDYRRITAQEIDRFPGQITRIDLVDTTHGPAKRCWRAGWMPGDRPRLSDVAPLAEGWTVESAADDLEAKGWKVRRWPNGARAWRIAPRPVRTGPYADRFRDRMLANPPASLEGKITSYDKYLDL
jgi:hypothetical protein